MSTRHCFSLTKLWAPAHGMWVLHFYIRQGDVPLDWHDSFYNYNQIMSSPSNIVLLATNFWFPREWQITVFHINMIQLNQPRPLGTPDYTLIHFTQSYWIILNRLLLLLRKPAFQYSKSSLIRRAVKEWFSSQVPQQSKRSQRSQAPNLANWPNWDTSQ